jgi:hypothetical protein
MAKKYIKIGTLMRNTKSGGLYVILGNEKATNEKYKFTTKVRVERPGLDPVQISNGLISVLDPRKNPNNKREVPESVVGELTLIQEE